MSSTTFNLSPFHLFYSKLLYYLPTYKPYILQTLFNLISELFSKKNKYLILLNNLLMVNSALCDKISQNYSQTNRNSEHRYKQQCYLLQPYQLHPNKLQITQPLFRLPKYKQYKRRRKKKIRKWLNFQRLKRFKKDVRRLLYPAKISGEKSLRRHSYLQV